MHPPEMFPFPTLLICKDHPEPEPEEAVKTALLLECRQRQRRVVMQSIGHDQHQGILGDVWIGTVKTSEWIEEQPVSIRDRSRNQQTTAHLQRSLFRRCSSREH